MTGPWGAQEGIGEGGRGSFLKVGVPLDRQPAPAHIGWKQHERIILGEENRITM